MKTITLFMMMATTTLPAFSKSPLPCEGTARDLVSYVSQESAIKIIKSAATTAGYNSKFVIKTEKGLIYGVELLPESKCLLANMQLFDTEAAALYY